jgi:hypothetical protein
MAGSVEAVPILHLGVVRYDLSPLDLLFSLFYPMKAREWERTMEDVLSI